MGFGLRGTLVLAAASTTYGHVLSSPLRGPSDDLAHVAIDNGTHSTVKPRAILVDHDRKDSFNDMFDHHGLERSLYHVTHYMAQRGRDRVLHQYPDFANTCRQQLDCSLSLDGMPDTIAQDVVNLKPAQQARGFSPQDFFDDLSWKGPQAELDSAMQTLMIRELIQPTKGLPDLHNTITKDKTLMIWLQILVKQAAAKDQGTPKKGHLKKAMDNVFESRPISLPPSADQMLNTTDTPDTPESTDLTLPGTLFLRSILKYGVCVGDEYLCNHYQEQENPMTPVLSLLRTATMDHVLNKHNYLRIALTELSDQPRAKQSGMRYPYKAVDHKGSKNKYKKRVIKAIQKAVKDAEAIAGARQLVVPDLRYQMEVFDTLTGRLGPATVVPTFGDNPRPIVSQLGYERFFAEVETHNGTQGLIYSRRLDNVRPVLAGSWTMIPVDQDLGRPSSGKSVPPTEDLQVFQVMKNHKGHVAVDSMGQPKLRSISTEPSLAKMLSAGSVSIHDQYDPAQRTAVRLFAPDGSSIRGPAGRFLAFEFIPGKKAGENAMSVMRQDVHFPDDEASGLVARAKTPMLHDPRASRSVYGAPLRVRLNAIWYYYKDYVLSGKQASSPDTQAVRKDFYGQYRSWKNTYEEMHSRAFKPMPKTSFRESLKGGAMETELERAERRYKAVQQWARGWKAKWNRATKAIKKLRPWRTAKAPDARAKVRGFVVDEDGLAIDTRDGAAENPFRNCRRSEDGQPGIMKRGVCSPSSGGSAEEGEPPRFGIDMAGRAAPVGEDGAVVGAEVATVGEAVEGALTAVTAVLGAVGVVAVLVPIAFLIAGLVENLKPDHTCPMRDRYTELWNPQIATVTTYIAPCEKSTTSLYNAFATADTPTATATAAPVIATGVGETSASPTSTLQVTTSTSIASTMTMTMTTTTTTSAPATPSEAEPPCTQYPLDKDFVYTYMQGMRCPIPLAYECTNDWFHHHVNSLPAGRRYPSYCTEGDVLGHFRAKEMGCLPDFTKKGCKKAFGLDKMSRNDWVAQRDDERTEKVDG